MRPVVRRLETQPDGVTAGDGPTRIPVPYHQTMTDRPAEWYPDPTGRFHYRYWNGTTWTDNVATKGVQAVDPYQAGLLDKLDTISTVGNEGDPNRIRQQVGGEGWRGAGISASEGGGGTIFTERVLVVNQKPKLFELAQQFSVFDQNGHQVAAVNQVGQSTARKALRLLTNVDQFLKTQLDITDNTGAVIIRLTRPGKIFKSTVIVENPSGGEVGRIVQRNVFGKIDFGLEVNEQEVGSINAENWRAWKFRIEDATGTEVARITKTFEGLAQTLFTTADNYVVQIHSKLSDPLLTLVVASALSVDTALKQDDRGFA